MPAAEPELNPQRDAMVRRQVEARGVTSPLVLAAMRAVPREAFVPEPMREFAYEDAPLPIDEGQTISQPYIVAFMIEALNLKGGEKVLEIGTGSGYAAAVLAEIAGDVFTVERFSQLAQKADAVLSDLGYRNVHVLHADGTRGWPKRSQSDRATYGHAALTGAYRTGENEVVRMLGDLLRRQSDYALHDGERFLDAVQNARLVANAERYYRIMYYGSRASWNLRDDHMFETLEDLLAFRGTTSKAIVWAHNSHVGDAAATEMYSRGEHNIGHLCRKRFGETIDRKSTRLNSSHANISYAVFCLKKKKI